jgi:predicted RecA/RadA family phage recombinase
MAKTFIQDGTRMTVTLGATLATGAGLLVGATFGVVLSGGVSGDIVELGIEGVWEINKLSTDVVAQGVLLYWDDTNKRLTVTASGNTLVAKAWEAAGNGVLTVKAKLLNT